MEQTMNTAVLRQTNRRRVLRYIYDSEQPVTKQEIAGDLSLSLPTVTGNLDELLEEGLVSCSGTQESTGGRKPRTYALEPRARVAVGITVQRDEVRLLAIDMQVQELGCREVPLSYSHTAEYYEKLSLCLEEFLDDFHLDRNRDRKSVV